MDFLEPINVDFTGGGKDNGKSSAADILIPPEHAGRKIAINLILTAIAAAVLYYFMIPALNFKAVELYLYVVFVVMIYLVLTVLSTKVFIKPEYSPYVRKRSKIPAIIIGVIAVVGLIGYLSGATFFRAQSYSKATLPRTLRKLTFQAFRAWIPHRQKTLPHVHSASCPTMFRSLWFPIIPRKSTIKTHPCASMHSPTAIFLSG